MATDYSEHLLQNIHANIELPIEDGDTSLIRGTYQYYHYGCDGFMDQGWGCGYRTLQTICSWVKSTLNHSTPVPRIPTIQNILVQLEDKPKSFSGSRDWIGSFEACLVIDHLYDIPCKIIHVNKGSELKQHVSTLTQHFNQFGSPVMMGGDEDCSAKGIMGIHQSGSEIYFLIVDPHFFGKARHAHELQKNGWVKWQHVEEFVYSSFYNMCLPQLAFKNS